MPLLSGIIIMVSGIFIFGVTDYVFALLESEKNNTSESSKIFDTLTTEINSKDSQIMEINIENSIQESVNLDIIENFHSLEEFDQTKNIIPLDESEILSSKTIKSDFETDTFYLKGSGDSWIKTRQSISPFEISAILIAQKDTKLTKFNLIDAKIIIGENNYSFNSGTAEIQKSNFLLNIYSNDDRIFFSMDGSFDYKIEDSKYSGTINFVNQPFYIYEHENQQLLTSYDATISTSTSKN